MNIHTVSILGSSFFEPISLLVKKLIEENKKSATDFGLINGLSSSVCLLSVASLESYVMSARYNSGERGKKLNEKIQAAKYIKKKYPDFSLEKEMIETYIVRDLLIHNHLWEKQYDNTTGKSVSDNRSDGDPKYRANIDENNKKTKILSLNIDPIEVKYSDAKILLENVWKILLFIEKKDNSFCYVSKTYVNYDGKQLLFGDILQKM